MRRVLLGMAAALAMAGSAQAEQLVATMHAVSADGIGPTLGTVMVTPTDAGASFLVQLQGLPPGEHGFHVHAMGDCGPANNADGHMTAAMQAGGHWDPQETKAHRGPEGDGHLGDLPFLTVPADGTLSTTVVAPRITDVAALHGKALMIHAGGDNFSDEPKPLGGGGARLACGVIQ